MKKLIIISQIIISLLLIAVILLQAKGEGLTSVNLEGKFYSTKRGPEKVIFVLTIILAILFFLVILANYLI